MQVPKILFGMRLKRFLISHLPTDFGAEDVVLVDMLQKISPSTDVFYLDTDFHFQETYDTRDRMQEKYNLEFVRVSPKITPEEQVASAWRRTMEI